MGPKFSFASSESGDEGPAAERGHQPSRGAAMEFMTLVVGLGQLAPS